MTNEQSTRSNMSPAKSDRKYSGQTSLRFTMETMPEAKDFSDVFEHIGKLVTTGTPGNQIVAVEYYGNTLKVEIQDRNG